MTTKHPRHDSKIRYYGDGSSVKSFTAHEDAVRNLKYETGQNDVLKQLYLIFQVQTEWDTDSCFIEYLVKNLVHHLSITLPELAHYLFKIHKAFLFSNAGKYVYFCRKILSGEYPFDPTVIEHLYNYGNQINRVEHSLEKAGCWDCLLLCRLMREAGLRLGEALSVTPAVITMNRLDMVNQKNGGINSRHQLPAFISESAKAYMDKIETHEIHVFTHRKIYYLLKINNNCGDNTFMLHDLRIYWRLRGAYLSRINFKE